MTESNIAEFRTKFAKALVEDNVASSIDIKDINRLKMSDDYVLCFIHWRRGDVEAAVKMAILVLKWRKENKINGLSAEEINTELLKRGIVFVHGRALDNTRVVYFVGRHQTKDNKVEVQKILCLWLERLHNQETGQHVTFVLDVSKTSMSNVDLGGIRFLMDCFITYFPDMLERIIILEMPWIMNAIWKVVKQWMTEQQRQRTAFLSFKQLNQFIAPDNILSYMGGEDQWEYEYPPPDDDIPRLTQIPNYEQDEISLQDEEEEDFVTEEVEITLTETKEISSQNAGDSETLLVRRHKPTENQEPNHLTVPQARKPIAVADANEKDTAVDTTVVVKSPAKPPLPGINLHSLLVLSPAAEITFYEESKDQKSGKYQSFVTLSNPNQTGQVAYKIKTNFPDRYHVKPSSGCVDAGESVKIRLNLSIGYEDVLNKDRFLILYAKKEDDDDLVEFWKSHMSKDKHNEYRMRAKFHSTTIEQANKSSPLKSIVTPEVTTSSPADVGLEKVKRDLSTVKNKLNVVENNTNNLRTKLHYSLAFNCVLLLCVFYVIHQLSLIAMLLQYDQSSRKL